jgi:hypothetical protein
MESIIHSPAWFFGIDSIFAFITFLVTIAIGLYSYKIYKLLKDKKYFYFALAFLFIAFSFITQAVVITLIALEILRLQDLFALIPTIYIIKNLGFLAYSALMVAAYMIILIISSKIKDRNIMSLLMILAVLGVLIGGANEMYNVFYVVSAILLGYIVKAYYSNYTKKKAKSAWFVLLSFSVIFIAQLFFIFYPLWPMFYVIGHIVQMIGYLILLGSLILVLRK